MIDRYSRPEMSRLWTDQYRFEKMLEVELLSTEALVKAGQVPASAYAKLRKRAKVNVARIRKIEEQRKLKKQKP
jgi:adenylosuccinate lyase